MSTEEWRPVVGYEGYYEVSNRGALRSMDRVSCQGHALRGQLIRQRLKHDGHWQITLRRDGRGRTFLVHRLVLLAFIGPALPGTEVLHRDGDGSNNALANLHWGTKSENIRDQVRHGTHIHRRKTACPKGHPYDDQNTYLTPGKQYRQCRACNHERELVRWPRRREEMRAKKASSEQKET